MRKTLTANLKEREKKKGTIIKEERNHFFRLKEWDDWKVFQIF